MFSCTRISNIQLNTIVQFVEQIYRNLQDLHTAAKWHLNLSWIWIFSICSEHCVGNDAPEGNKDIKQNLFVYFIQ